MGSQLPHGESRPVKPEHRPTEHRNRAPMSCEPCRSRKLRCNREQPCDSCVKRRKSWMCQYSPHANRSKATNKPLKDRLQTLETVVSSFLAGDIAAPQPESQPVKSVPGGSENNQAANLANSSQRRGTDNSDYYSLTPERPHVQETRDGQVNYIDRSHWQSILEDIKEVKDHLADWGGSPAQSLTSQQPDDVEHDASFLIGCGSNDNLAEILTSLPPQHICDRMLSGYFNSRFLIAGIVHPDKFQKEYEAFWEAPTKTSPLWIGLLFSILGFTAVVGRLSNFGVVDSSIPSPKILQQRAIQCLVLGRYATANAYALEAFLLHLQSCAFIHDDPPVNLWFEMGTLIRLAFRMGYHRDPSHLSGISPFDGEMRRRVWLNIFQIEALMSFQLGFPSMIPTEFCDSKVPRNLDYSDLRVDMAELPPSKPLEMQTVVQYSIVKADVMAVFKKIVAHTQSLSTPSYESTLALDAEMKHVYSNMSESFKRRNVDRCFMDSASLILQRCTIEILFLKSLVVLNRRYVSYDLQDPRFEASRRTCVEAALDILARQADLHKACEPGSRLHDDRWMVFALPVHDFLLAAMVVCLDLSVRMRSRVDRGDLQLTSREYEALEGSRRIWGLHRKASPEMNIASLALDLMMKKVANEENVPTDGLEVVTLDSTDSIAAVGNMELPYAEPMSQMIDGNETIDWGLLDQYFQNLDSMNPEHAFQFDQSL